MTAPTPKTLLAEALRSPTEPLKRALGAGVRRGLGASPDALDDYALPPGDPGLFGPDSVAWTVHADLPAMLIGGISALLFQTLHPLAMAGVAGHSRFREDPYGRLARTARFVAGTTFGGVGFAERLIGEVRAVHERVQGVAPDGRRYSASDPELLCFVHTTEVWSFLRSYQRYARRPLLAVEKDRYLDEVAVVAEALGATGVPRDVAAVRRYFAAIDPKLAFTKEAAETVRFLLRPMSRAPLEVAGHEVLLAAAVGLLPPAIRGRLGFSPLRSLSAPAVLGAGRALGHTLRWAIGPSVVAAIAAARVEATTVEVQRSVVLSANPDRRGGARTF